MNQRQKSFLDSYNYALDRYGCRRLCDAYKSYSWEKSRAYDYCLNLKDKKSGYDGTVVGAGNWFFSYAFKYMGDEGKEHLMYITHANDYDFVIDD